MNALLRTVSGACAGVSHGTVAVVFLNALSGTLAYGHMHRIDYRAGLLFGAATVPGAVLGAYATSLLSRQLFDLLFGILVLSLATFILVRPTPKPRPTRVYRRHVTHTLVDYKGTSYSYSFSNRLGVLSHGGRRQFRVRGDVRVRLTRGLEAPREYRPRPGPNQLPGYSTLSPFSWFLGAAERHGG